MKGTLLAAACVLAARAEAAPHADGEGPVLAVTRPASFELDFGTIARGQLASRDVLIHNPGSAALEVTLGAPGAPFTAPATLGVGPGELRSFAIACRSPAPVPPAEADVTLASNAAQSNTAAITVRCAVADTRLEVTPGALDFGEVRHGAMPATIPLELRNPGPAPMMLQEVRLEGAPGSLRLEPELSAPQPLAPGASLELTLTLAPTAELELEGARLAIGVDAARLALPITGAIVTPSARVSPDALDLGTACVGTQVTGSVRLINSGTATLTMQEPAAGGAFTALLERPASYPAQLPPGYAATASVVPRAQAIGTAEGTLAWDVDAPAGPFSVPVTLRYIDAGTAISPRRLVFGSLEAGRTSPRQTVTFENCNSQPVRLAIEGVVAAEGDRDAWDVSPSSDERTLGPRDKLQLTAVFRPQRAGRHVARIQLAIDGAPGEVELSGDALGDLPAPTSFYACSCRGAPAPSPAAVAPIALAALLALRRPRRRRVSGPPVSGRCRIGSS